MGCSIPFEEILLSNQHLKWTFHISHIKKKIAKGLGVINKAKKYLNYGSLRTLYYSFVHPYFDYCLEVWGCASTTLMNSLFRMQKKAIRSITMSGYRDHTAPLFKFCKILTLEELHVSKVSIFMYRVHKRMAPEIFYDYFVSNSLFHRYNTRGRRKLRPPRFLREVMKQSIRVKGVYYWNYVSTNVAYDCSLLSFKFGLRRFLLGNTCITNLIP